MPKAAESLRQWLQEHRLHARLIVLLHPTLLFKPRSQDDDQNERLMASEAAQLKAMAVQGVRRLWEQLPVGTDLYYLWLPVLPPPCVRATANESKEPPPEGDMAWLACARCEVCRAAALFSSPG